MKNKEKIKLLKASVEVLNKRVDELEKKQIGLSSSEDISKAISNNIKPEPIQPIKNLTFDNKVYWFDETNKSLYTQIIKVIMDLARDRGCFNYSIDDMISHLDIKFNYIHPHCNLCYVSKTNMGTIINNFYTDFKINVTDKIFPNNGYIK